MPFALAVSVADCGDATEAMVAVKDTDVAFAATVTDAGTVTADLVLARLTLKPPVGAADERVTVQASEPTPLKDALSQLRPVIVGTGAAPTPVRLTRAGLPVEELLATLSWPVADPALVGSNTTTNCVDWPGLSVAGNIEAAKVNPVPVKLAELTVNGAVPVDFSVTDWLASVFSVTLPKARVAVLKLSAGVAPFNCRLKICEELPSVAVSIAV